MKQTVKLAIGTEEIEIETGTQCLITIKGEPHWVNVELTKANQDKPYRSRDWLADAYHTKEMTLAEIGRLCGVSPMTINQWLVKHNIPSRSRGRR